MKLSVIIPVFNEEKTVGKTLRRLVETKNKDIVEIIIINDGSTDATASVISNIKFPISNLKSIQHKINQGKGAAVRTGIKNATGDYILIQDADLEYNPKDIKKLTDLVKNGQSEVVYGTRLNRLPNFFRDERTLRFLTHYLGNRFLSLVTSILYKQWMTDMETGYKLFPRKAVLDVKLKAKGFEFEPEITAKLLKKGYTILELPISTNPRGYKEGKKLNTITDGIIAFWTLLRCRFSD